MEMANTGCRDANVAVLYSQLMLLEVGQQGHPSPVTRAAESVMIG
jgi:hypothetical protein